MMVVLVGWKVGDEREAVEEGGCEARFAWSFANLLK